LNEARLPFDRFREHMKGHFPVFQPLLRRRFLWVVAGSLFSGCAPSVRFATDAESAATGLVLRVRRLSVESDGEMTLVNAGQGPCFVSPPSPCTVVVLRYDAQHQRLNLNHTFKRICSDLVPGLALRLAPGDSIRYALTAPRVDYNENNLRQARFFAVSYQGCVSAQAWDAQRVHRSSRYSRRFPRYTVKATGPIE
jgi:hypothetical protein